MTKEATIVYLDYAATTPVDPRVVENLLYKHTPLQETFGINAIALVDGRPETLTLKRQLESRPLYACEVTGVRHDTGNKLGFLKASVHFGLKRPDVAGPLRDYLKSLNLD